MRKAQASVARLVAWLQKRMARTADAVATAALEAVQTQRAVLPGQDLAAIMMALLAQVVITPAPKSLPPPR